MTDTIDTIKVDGGKYTVELGHKNGRFSFTALRNGLPWRDMSSDGDNLMLAMFQQLRDQQDRIAQLERAATEPVQSTIRRWDVLDGSSEAIEAEPTYTMTMDPAKGVVEIRPAGVSNEQLEGLPQLLLGVEINGGAPRVYIYDDVLSGEVKHQFTALPDGELAADLEETPDAQVIGERIRLAVARSASQQSPESDQAPRA
ncbi:hypothetical protein [Variovorax ginsengisoli]|uniref:Uncharacterized protein n=1 Tax=Variovorax ginsengisoli TaxID=363844 RepID=A0ABT8SDQ8_9BURK|nr:hypothetical protein [Variovorax ginsengisoli]MDN8616411.1 hypothetical protein [Variovorax ginsengisoli]MDO1535581.1 hypothetical protein [Variovorax ginsengisoli]